MVSNQKREQNIKPTRRGFLTITAMTGTALTFFGTFSHGWAQTTQPTTAPSSMPSRISFGGPVKFKEGIPIIAKSQIVDIGEISFESNGGAIRVWIDYRFVDGRLDGGAIFKLILLGKDQRAIAEQSVRELRNRNLPVEQHGPNLKMGGPDKPNRIGRVAFRFGSILPTDITEFYLDVTDSQ